MSENTSAVLLPCLKEFKWAGRELTVCRALWPPEPSPYMPWLAFGYDHPDMFEFISRDRLRTLNLTKQTLEAQAVANLRQRAVTWQSVETDVGSGRRLELLVCSDDFFAAERILDAEFMKDAQRRLKASGLMVGIPRRGSLLVASVDRDDRLITGFGALVADEFSRGETPVISPMLFAVKDGAIVAFLEAAARVVVPADPPAPLFSWWTGLPSWIRLLIGFAIGLLVLNRVLIDFLISLRP